MIDSYWQSLGKFVDAYISQNGCKLIQVRVTAVNASGWVDVQRPQNDSPDGIYYPVISPAYKPVVNDWVWALAVSGGLVVLGRNLAVTDKDLKDFVLKAGDTMTGNLTLSKPLPQVRLQDTNSARTNSYLQIDSTQDQFRILDFDGSTIIPVMTIKRDGTLTFPRYAPTVVSATLQNGWTNFGGANPNAGYIKDPLGYVQLSGLIAPGTTTSGTTMLTLASNYRPVGNKRFSCPGSNKHVSIIVLTTGEVQILAFDAATLAWVDLSPIRFHVSV